MSSPVAAPAGSPVLEYGTFFAAPRTTMWGLRGAACTPAEPKRTAPMTPITRPNFRRRNMTVLLLTRPPVQLSAFSFQLEIELKAIGLPICFFRLHCLDGARHAKRRTLLQMARQHLHAYGQARGSRAAGYRHAANAGEARRDGIDIREV